MLKKLSSSKNIKNISPQIFFIKNYHVNQHTKFYAEESAITSHDLAEAKANVLLLYRRFLKILPWVRETYHVPADLKVMIRRMHMEFGSYQGVTEKELIDQLLIRGYQEHEEVLMHHKQRGHILKFFSEADLQTARPKPQEFKRIAKEKIDTEAVLRQFTAKGMGHNIGRYLKTFKE